MNFSLEKADSVRLAVYDFEPSAERIRILDQRIRSGLGASLRHIFDRGEAYFTVPRERLDAFLAQLERTPISPLAFSLYCDLVIAIERDDLEHAFLLLRELIALPEHLGGTSVIELADARHDATAMRYRRFADTDPEMPVEIFPPSPEAARISRSLIQSAFALMEKGDPPLASEIRALLREIILAAGSKAPDALTFDGISSFMFWGAIIINADRSRGELEMVQMLAHESAHNLLFGLSADEPLLDNSAEERYPSPLRADPRPLEGIYHATFVTARMHRAVRRLVESHVLSPRLEEEARRQLEIHSRGFAQGMEVIEQHARLTAPGEAIIQGARVYMASG